MWGIAVSTVKDLNGGSFDGTGIIRNLTNTGINYQACEGHFGDWSGCDTTCGEGHKTRTYVIDIQPENKFAVQCEFQNGEVQYAICNTFLHNTPLLIHLLRRFLLFETT